MITLHPRYKEDNECAGLNRLADHYEKSLENMKVIKWAIGKGRERLAKQRAELQKSAMERYEITGKLL